MAITRDDITRAAETLLARGENPTLAAVRAELGGGSYTTISEALKGWREQRAKARALAEVVQIPAPVQEAMNQVVTTVWTAATREHAVTLAAEREALAAERRRLEGERLEAVELADQVNRELELVQIRVREIAADLEAERLSHAETRAAMAAAEAATRERGERIGALSTELEKVRKGEREARDEAAEIRGKLAALKEAAPKQDAGPPRKK
ncbi:MAG: DNA-binding protein [Pseudomonadota bacterium]|nr:DNA-binding protein [Pseudomonadota bacterium]